VKCGLSKLLEADTFSGDKATGQDEHADRQEKPAGIAWKQKRLAGRGEMPFARWRAGLLRDFCCGFRRPAPMKK
jgi:hypothetical protein